LLDMPIRLPMDADAFETKLKELIMNSRHEKKVREVNADDFTKSFNR
jgi:hypothetical protein